MANNSIKNPSDLEKFSPEMFVVQANKYNIVGEFKSVARSNFKTFLIRFSRNYFSLAGLIVFIAVILLAIIFPLVSPYEASKEISGVETAYIANLPPYSSSGLTTLVLTDANLSQLEGAGIEYTQELISPGRFLVTFDLNAFLKAIGYNPVKPIIGTTPEGWDIWTTMWEGTRNSILLAISVVLISSVVGITIGCYLGFNAGKPVDTFAMRVVDLITAIPAIIIYILLAAIFKPGFGAMLLIFSSLTWVAFVRQSRNLMIRTKDMEFILAARAIGASKFRQIFIHAFPNIIGRLSVVTAHAIPGIILSEATLSFLGILDNKTATLGSVIQLAIQSGIENNILFILVPSIIVLAVTMSVQFISNGLNDALNVMKQR